MKIEAKDTEELFQALQTTEITVPPRTEGRKTKHTELYSICHLLSTLAASNRLIYPLSIIHSDRPDFVMTHDGIIIGIEHTEAIPQNEAAKQALREKSIAPRVHFITPTKVGDECRSFKELKAEIEADEMGDGWIGDHAEREWAEAIAHFVDLKERKLRIKGFRHYEEDWLLVYENWPLPYIDLNRAAQYFHETYKNRASDSQFHRIYVISSGSVCEFDNVMFSLLPDKDLWQKNIPTISVAPQIRR